MITIGKGIAFPEKKEIVYLCLPDAGAKVCLRHKDNGNNRYNAKATKNITTI